MYLDDVLISIHAAREGGDHVTFGDLWEQYISIHAAREGGDAVLSAIYPHVDKFQSTPPVKAATRQLTPFGFHPQISIHAAREGGDPDLSRSGASGAISIHAAREGGDFFAGDRFFRLWISIHAAREGGDK